MYNGTIQQVKARREVIVCAGTIGTAQLLMLSGIGPRKHLQELDVGIIEQYDDSPF